MFDWQSLSKYILEGLAVSIAMYFIPSKKLQIMDIVMIALTSAAVFAILDQFSPVVASGARHGTGFGMGYQQIGLGDENKADVEDLAVGPIDTKEPDWSPDDM